MYCFAPSLSEDMPIDDLRAALFCFICAGDSGEQMMIRIEDMENRDDIAERVDKVLEMLSLFGITWDQISYQSENLKFHRQLAAKLLMDKNAFTCFCTPEQLTEKRKAAEEANTLYSYDGTCKKLSDIEVLDNESPFVIRSHRPQQDIVFEVLIQGAYRFTPDEIDDFVIMHVDNRPTHTFASAIDDMMFDISTVIHSRKYFTDTPKEIVIRRYLGYDKEIRYAHLPPIDTEEGYESVTPAKLLEEGFLPSAIATYLIVTAIEAPVEISTLEEAIAQFDLKKVSPKSVTFNRQKLMEINRKQIEQLAPKKLSAHIGYSSEDIGELAKCYLHEAATLKEIKEKIDKIFAPKKSENFEETLQKMKNIAKEAPYFQAYDDFESYMKQKSGLEKEAFERPFRLLLTGAQSGPDLDTLYPYIRNYLGEIIK